MLGLAIGNRSCLSRLCGDHSAEMGDVAAQIVGHSLVLRGVDARSRNGPVAVRRHLVPFLEMTHRDKAGQIKRMVNGLLVYGGVWGQQTSSLE